MSYDNKTIQKKPIHITSVPIPLIDKLNNHLSETRQIKTFFIQKVIEEKIVNDK